MLKKLVLTKVAEDYYSLSEYEYNGRQWELVGGYGEPRFYDLPDYIQKRHPRRAIRKVGDSYTFYACQCTFPHPAYMGKGWINSQGEELPDRNRLMYAGW